MTPTTIDHQALFDLMPIPRFIVKREGDGFIVVQANAKALLFFGRPAEQVIGQDIAAVLDNENAHHMIQSFEVAMRKNLPVTIQSLPTFPGDFHVPGFWVNPVTNTRGDVELIDVMAQPSKADDSVGASMASTGVSICRVDRSSGRVNSYPISREISFSRRRNSPVGVCLSRMRVSLC